MPHTSLKRLEKTACKTGAGEEKLMLWVAVMRKESMDIHKIARMPYTPYVTVCDRLLRLHKGRLKRLSNKRRRGARARWTGKREGR